MQTVSLSQCGMAGTLTRRTPEPAGKSMETNNAQHQMAGWLKNDLV